METLEADRGSIVESIESMEKNQLIVTEDIVTPTDESGNKRSGCISLKNFISVKPASVKLSTILSASSKSIRKINIQKAMDWVQGELAICLAEKQIDAVRTAIESKVMVITGGPGTGKTTIISAVLKIFEKLRIKSRYHACRTHRPSCKKNE